MATATFVMSLLFSAKGFAQGADAVVEKLAAMGFENVRSFEDATEVVLTLESNVYKIKAAGIAKAIREIQSAGLVGGKKCTVIVTDNNVPLVALKYGADDEAYMGSADEWNVTSRNFDDSWNKVKRVKRKNTSFLNVDVLVYPQLYYKNLIINQIYQVLLELSPAIEVTLWSGAKLTAQVIYPVYNDGYSGEYENVRPGYLTLQQQFRLPWNITGDVRVGVFDTRTYGTELNLLMPLKDEHFSIAGKLGYVGVGYFKKFRKFTYSGDDIWYWSIGPNYYWARYNMEFKFRAEQYLMHEIGVKAEMMRHFTYFSFGLYAEKAQHADTNGGFRLYVALPPYKYKRYKKFPRVSTGLSTGTTYNGGNERTYYLMPFTAADDNPLKQNQFNPFFIKSKIK